MKERTSFFSSLRSDIPSSIVVFLVALPLCLGVALASKAPLFSGLIAGMIGGIVIGALSGSQLSVSGPAAGLTAIVSAAILLMPGGSFPAFLVSVVICGVLQIAMGFARAGSIGDYVPSAVIKGMLAAIGLILILNQFPHLLGDDSQFETDEAVPPPAKKGNIFTNFFLAFGNINKIAFLIGGVCLAFHFLWEKLVTGRKGFVRLIPAPLLVVLIGIGIAQSMGGNGALDPQHLVKLPQASSANEFFSFFTKPDWSVIMNSHVWITGVTLAIVASLETLLSIEAIDDLDPYQRVTDKNRELKAQGVGNFISGMIGGLPVTSVIVRSSANVNSGAQSKKSTIMHGTLLLLCVAFIPSLLNLIPKAALAAVLIFTGYKLAKPALFVDFYKKGWDQFLPFVITIAAILATDLLKGVVIGIFIGLFFVLRSNFKTAVMVVSDANRHLFRLRKDVSFLNKAIIKNRLEKVPENSYVLIDASRADFIDRDVVEVIEDFTKHAHLKNIQVEVKGSLERTNGLSRFAEKDDAPYVPQSDMAS
ncbi:SulP family inorganic anion transporter [Flaviaesturariibacter amylovorans]|uniref:SulP family inorganic anion transporter n=1 Tax=Flaviaesturariibacter amylovorans TaxID=1084520 RepID=A0ABP8G565_9BACT